MTTPSADPKRWPSAETPLAPITVRRTLADIAASAQETVDRAVRGIAERGSITPAHAGSLAHLSRAIMLLSYAEECRRRRGPDSTTAQTTLAASQDPADDPVEHDPADIQAAIRAATGQAGHTTGGISAPSRRSLP